MFKITPFMKQEQGYPTILNFIFGYYNACPLGKIPGSAIGQECIAK